MKTLRQLEQLEQLQHDTGLTGAALEAEWQARHANPAKEFPLYDAKGGPVHESYVRALLNK